MKIEQHKTSFGCSEKRFYLPCKITDSCPECGRVVTLDLEDTHPLSYPTFNAPQDVVFYCIDWDEDGEEILNCENSWTRQIKIEISIREYDD